MCMVVVRFERNVKGPGHYHHHLYSQSMVTLKERHSQYQVSNAHGKQAYTCMQLQYWRLIRIHQWKKYIRSCIQRGCSQLYILFRTIFPSLYLVEKVLSSALEYSVHMVRHAVTTTSQQRTTGGSNSSVLSSGPPLSTSETIGGDVSVYIFIYEYIYQYISDKIKREAIRKRSKKI